MERTQVTHARLSRVIQRQESPLAKVAPALCAPRLFLRPVETRQQQARQYRNDGNDDEQLDEHCVADRASSVLLRASLRAVTSVRPRPARTILPGSGTATTVSSGRFAAVPEFLEVNTPLTLLSAAKIRRLR